MNVVDQMSSYSRAGTCHFICPLQLFVARRCVTTKCFTPSPTTRVAESTLFYQWTSSLFVIHHFQIRFLKLRSFASYRFYSALVHFVFAIILFTIVIIVDVPEIKTLVINNVATFINHFQLMICVEMRFSSIDLCLARIFFFPSQQTLYSVSRFEQSTVVVSRHVCSEQSFVLLHRVFLRRARLGNSWTQ